MNSSLLAGLGVGTGIVLAGAVVSSLVFQPQHSTPPLPESVAESVAEPLIEEQQAIAAPEAAQEEAAPIVEEQNEEVVLADDTAPLAEPEAEQHAEAETTELPTETLMAEAEAPVVAEEEDATTILQTQVRVPDLPDAATSPEADAAPQVPPAQEEPRITRLPSAVQPPTSSANARDLPQISPPQLPQTSGQTSPETELADDADAARPPVSQQDEPQRPGLRVAGLPQIGTADELPVPPEDLPQARDLAGTALERNALYAGDSAGRPRMALVFSDPGLPGPMRRDLAALDMPMTIALNPLDSSAADGAEIYREAGKEILILATSLPSGATASDLDITFSTFFQALPQAVGVIDLPENGFARNTAMLGNILPLLAQDGHGLVTFAGGLAQAARAAETAGVAHTEVFRMLERGSESAFTIRRYLDRAMFHASQAGEVVVFGDASNEATMDALRMWLDDGRAEQVALVPISAILMGAE